MKKKKTKRLVFFIVPTLVIGLFILIIGKLYAFSSMNAGKLLTKNDNQIIYTVNEYNRFIHIKLNASSVKYSIIDPKGEEVKSGEITKNDEYFGEGIKGDWKIVFDIASDVNIDYSIWTGNLEDRDTLKSLDL